MEGNSDNQLLQQHLAGDAGALERLIVRYSDDLYRFLIRFVNNPAAAEDLVQETFLQVHLSASSFDTSRRFKPWLFTIAANKARDYLRSRVRKPELSLEQGDSDSEASFASTLPAEIPEVSEQATVEERKQAVRALVARLPENLRMVLLLGYFQQLPYADIAEALDIPVGTVKSRLHAAVNQFAKLWQEASGDEAQQ